MKDRYNTALGRLAADAREVIPPLDLESALLGEFDRRRKNRSARPILALLAVAAAVSGVWFFRPRPVESIGLSAALPPAPWSSLKPMPRIRAAAPGVRATPASAAESEHPFVPIPYVTPLDPYERVNVVRMDLPVAELIAVGLQVEADDAGARVQADVVVGQDGRARAVRLVSISNRN